ncbi:MAG: transporter substrate-binding domain-containing protein, partial [Alphaproteobacteria bacterium]|nr:transporter substrate-binding domain-containing protein [Alphaproteobacteria bacterium]
YQEDGIWHGIDADFCRIFAQAIFGDSQKIEMIDVRPNRVAEALDKDVIDVMLSGAGYVASMEAEQKAVSAGVLYYDHQMVMVKDVAVTALEQMKGQKICLSTDTDYFQNFDNYNIRYNLGISYLSFNNLAKAKEAFLLSRCQMMTASGLMLHGILKDMPKGKAKILPELIALKPVYAFVQKNNSELRVAIKWILNALLLAEQHGMNAHNLEYFASNESQEMRNLLGDDKALWDNMNLNPNWVREVIALLGNYAEIFDRNMGANSEYHLLRREGRLVKDGGTVYPIPFL